MTPTRPGHGRRRVHRLARRRSVPRQGMDGRHHRQPRRAGKRENVPAAATLHELDIRDRRSGRSRRDGGTFDVIVASRGADRRPAERRRSGVRRERQHPRHAEPARGAARERPRPTTRVVFASTGGAHVRRSSPTPPNVETIAEGAGLAVRDREARRRVLPRRTTRASTGSTPSRVRFGNVYGPRQDPHGEAGVVAIFCGRILAGRAADGLRRRLADARLRPRRATSPTATCRAATTGAAAAAACSTTARSTSAPASRTSVLELAEVLRRGRGVDGADRVRAEAARRAAGSRSSTSTRREPDARMDAARCRSTKGSPTRSAGSQRATAASNAHLSPSTRRMLASRLQAAHGAVPSSPKDLILDATHRDAGRPRDPRVALAAQLGDHVRRLALADEGGERRRTSSAASSSTRRASRTRRRWPSSRRPARCRGCSCARCSSSPTRAWPISRFASARRRRAAATRRRRRRSAARRSRRCISCSTAEALATSAIGSAAFCPGSRRSAR